MAQFISPVVGYNQVVIQNPLAGTGNSTNLIFGNDSGSTATKYAEVGLNSSTFTGSGSFSLPNALYLDNTLGDTVIGTINNYAIHFVVDNSNTDIMTLQSGSVSISGHFINTGATCASIGPIGKCITSTGADGYCSGALNACTSCTEC